MSFSTKQPRHVYDYFIDEHGDWFCEGNPVTDPPLFRLLSRALFAREGHYFLHCDGEVHPVRVADAPLWIRYVHLQTDAQGNLLSVAIELQDGRHEALAATTLTVADNQALYCLATGRRLRARFGKVAYYELTHHLQMDEVSGRFFFVIGGCRYDIYPES